MTTSKTLRLAPPRRFENYTFNSVTSPDSGMVRIPDSTFSTIIAGGSDDTITDFLDLGFSFSFDNITYNRFIACANGWMILVGPTETNSSVVTGSLLTSGSASNEGINLTNASQNILLAPWFDDLKLVSDLPSVSGSSDTQRRISEGLEQPSTSYNPTEFGVKVFYDTRSTLGRRTVVRWNALGDASASASLLKFEAVIYENGTIEYRYPPKQSLSLADTVVSGTFAQDATVGIFMPGTNRFRDLSYGLGYLDNARQQYKYGAATYSTSFFDSGIEASASGSFVSRQYVWRLRPTINWPGAWTQGTNFVFAPPVNRRTVLPRLELRNRDSLQSVPNGIRTVTQKETVSFDDRRTVNFVAAGMSGSTVTGSLVNFPTSLNRAYSANDQSAVSRQSLYSGDFEFTGSVVKSSVDSFIESSPRRTITAFSENKLFENDPSSSSDGFFTGSNLIEFGDSLSQPLKSKTQIKFSLPVKFSTKMFGVSSSIYYYNKTNGSWMTPRASSYASIKAGQVGTVDTAGTSGKGDICNPANDSLNKIILEDSRGFGPIGNVIVSGSHPRGLLDQSDASIGSTYNSENVNIALSKYFDKSVSNSDDYQATSAEVLSLPITEAFVIEKAVIEIPFAAGTGWFSDKTTCIQPLETNSGSFDFGGPALTVALYNQHKIGNSSRRDLVMTGTITHTFDNVAEIVFSNFPSIDSTYQVRPMGYLAFDKSPGSIVTPVSTSSGFVFTGSVAVKCEAQVSNGVIARMTRLMTFSSANINRQGVIDTLVSSELPMISQISTNFEQRTKIAYINNYGRASTGFSPSGRSTFGKELVSNSSKAKIANPFYVAGSPSTLATVTSGTLSQQFVAAIQSGSNFTFQAAVPLIKSTPSPYTVYPGDNLVLAISKTRPVFYGNATGQITSGSISHDVQLLTGTINITLYGSVLRANKEHHDTLSQKLSQHNVQEIVIGGEGVNDTYSVEYSDMYVNGFYDDLITGSMLTKTVKSDGTLVLSASSRGRVVSMINARSSGFPSSNSKAYNAQPWFERAGSVRFNDVSDATERYWDSLMPSISECFKADGTNIWINTGDPNVFGADATVDKHNVGYMIFDFQIAAGFADPSALQLINGNWTWAYPFEPRYSKISRQLNPTNQFIATFKLVSGTPVSIEPTVVNGLFAGPAGVSNAYGAYQWLFMSDVGLKNPNIVLGQPSYITGSAAQDDLARFLYGFGDLSTTYIHPTYGIRFGANHFASYRDINLSGPVSSEVATFAQSPLIRGWKYGVYSGIAAYSKAYFSKTRYGQHRDMLEQRPYTKFHNGTGARSGATVSVVSVKFVDSAGKITQPENTYSQNLSMDATSSVPYVDGETRNRTTVNVSTLNKSILTFNASQFGNITL